MTGHASYGSGSIIVLASQLSTILRSITGLNKDALSRLLLSIRRSLSRHSALPPIPTLGSSSTAQDPFIVFLCTSQTSLRAVDWQFAAPRTNTLHQPLPLDRLTLPVPFTLPTTLERLLCTRIVCQCSSPRICRVFRAVPKHHFRVCEVCSQG